MLRYGVGQYGNGLYSAATENELEGQVPVLTATQIRVYRDRPFASTMNPVFGFNPAVAKTAGLSSVLDVVVDYVGDIQYALNKMMAGTISVQLNYQSKLVADYVMRVDFYTDLGFTADPYLGKYWNPEPIPTTPWAKLPDGGDIWVPETINERPWN